MYCINSLKKPYFVCEMIDEIENIEEKPPISSCGVNIQRLTVRVNSEVIPNPFPKKSSYTQASNHTTTDPQLCDARRDISSPNPLPKRT